MDELEPIKRKIYEIRGQRVMLDFDLATMYGVETRVLNQAVKRNIERFPEDFMFQLTKGELEILRSQIVTLNDWKSQIVTSNFVKMGLRKTPYAFTENGVAMLSSVLRSPLAIQVNIGIYVENTNANWVAVDNFILRYYGPHPLLQGDVNGDGIVNSDDVTTLVAYILGIPAPHFLSCAADINTDGLIDIADITALVNLLHPTP